MSTPRLEIDLNKITHNATMLKELYGSKGIDVIGVTKAICGEPVIADALLQAGINILADSRIDNIIKMRNSGIDARFMLLRTPCLSQSQGVVKFADISLNSELIVIQKLAHFAIQSQTTHQIILMVELGDLREGLMPKDLDRTIQQVLKLEGIELVGLGTNLACFGGIKPDNEKMEMLSSIAIDVEKKFDLLLEFISGGNSANYNWFMSATNIGKINNLRLGESIYLGCETLDREPIAGLVTDAFTLVAEVIESKTKPSLPYGKTGQDAFGNTPVFQDQGSMRRAILGIGLQDIPVSGLTPRMDIDILGASSDHMIINTKNIKLQVGDELTFNLNYGALLAAMTSSYVYKEVKSI